MESQKYLDKATLSRFAREWDRNDRPLILIADADTIVNGELQNTIQVIRDGILVSLITEDNMTSDLNL